MIDLALAFILAHEPSFDRISHCVALGMRLSASTKNFKGQFRLVGEGVQVKPDLYRKMVADPNGLEFLATLKYDHGHSSRSCPLQLV